MIGEQKRRAACVDVKALIGGLMKGSGWSKKGILLFDMRLEELTIKGSRKKILATNGSVQRLAGVAYGKIRISLVCAKPPLQSASTRLHNSKNDEFLLA